MKVFKKRTGLPLLPLPKPPTHDQMVEDIMSSQNNDPVFIEGSCQKTFEDFTNVDEEYDTVKEFIEANNSLNGLVKEIGERLLILQNSRDELQGMAGKIKQRAIEALK